MVISCFDVYEFIENLLKAGTIDIVDCVCGDSFAVSRFIGVDWNVVESSVLIQAEAFFADEEASAKVDQNMIAFPAFAAQEKMRKIYTIDLAVKLDAGDRVNGRQHIHKAEEFIANGLLDVAGPPSQ